MSQQLITISGQLGSGKSTIAKKLAEKLGWQYYSTGMAQRLIAEKRGLNTLELNELAQKDPSIDQEIDGVFLNPPWKKAPCVVDSRLAFHFLPHSFKVKLIIDPNEAAKRVFLEKRSNEKYKTLAQTKEFLQERSQLEKERFIKIYQVDITNPDFFDLIIDTTHLTIEQVCDKIIKAL